MAVSITGTSKTFTGTGVPSVYAPEFYASNSAQIQVRVDGVLKTIGDDYVVSNVGAAAGVDVTANFTAGSVVFIERVTPITQLVDTQNNETILEDVIDAGFDKLTMIAQELTDKAGRAILFPRGESGQTLPEALARRGMVLAFNSGTGALELLPAVSATAISLGLLLSGQLPFVLPDEANGDAVPAPGSKLPYLSAGVMKIA